MVDQYDADIEPGPIRRDRKMTGPVRFCDSMLASSLAGSIRIEAVRHLRRVWQRFLAWCILYGAVQSLSRATVHQSDDITQAVERFAKLKCPLRRGLRQKYQIRRNERLVLVKNVRGARLARIRYPSNVTVCQSLGDSISSKLFDVVQ
jgi:hypothetical protein